MKEVTITLRFVSCFKCPYVRTSMETSTCGHKDVKAYTTISRDPNKVLDICPLPDVGEIQCQNKKPTNLKMR